MCGLFGVWGSPRAVGATLAGLFALQHRGQESAGLAVLDATGGLLLRRGMGLVTDAIGEDGIARLIDATADGPGAAVGHVRYSTTGATTLDNAQPLVGRTLSGPLGVAHNGNLVNGESLRAALAANGAVFRTTTDSEILLHRLARGGDAPLEVRLPAALDGVEGAYAFLIITPEGIAGVRDPLGLRPLVLGRLRSGAACLASESCAVETLGGTVEREVEPGEAVFLGPGGVRSLRIAEATPARCAFEHVYFARPDSVVFGLPVYEVRKRLGGRLAVEHPAEADVVVPIPDSGSAAALGFAETSGIPYEGGFMRNHFVGRSFIQPSDRERVMAGDRKLSVIRSVISGRRVVIVDDSIVRGNTMGRRVGNLRAAGAREVHVRVSCPPIVSPCYYGIDFTTTDELVAASRSVEEVGRLIGVDSIGYLSLDGMLEVLGGGGWCTACWSRSYPVPVRDRVDRNLFESRGVNCG